MRLAPLLAVLFISGTAYADVIAVPPPRCPLGSMSIDFCHGPPTCAAVVCDTASDCGAGQVCSTVQACVREHCCSGRCCGGGCPEEPTLYTHFEQLCAGGACADGSTSCESVSVCVPAPDTDAGTDGGATDSGTDSGGTDSGGTDSGGTDSGGTDSGGTDSGGTDSGRNDSGGTADAGVDSSGGGCCAVFGGRDGTGAAAVTFLVIAVLARRRWR